MTTLKLNQKEELLWASGLFEGEGCIRFVKHNNNQVQLICAMKDKDIIERFQQTFKKGSIRLQKTNQYRWTVSRIDDCFEIITKILPYLGIRRTIKAKKALQILHKKMKRRLNVDT